MAKMPRSAARRRVLEGAKRIARQEARIDELRREGDANLLAEAVEMLVFLVGHQTVLEQHLREMAGEGIMHPESRNC